MPPIRSPKGATHSYALGAMYEMFWARYGCRVFAYNKNRNEWWLTNHEPSYLENFHPLNVFEMHPETAVWRCQLREKN